MWKTKSMLYFTFSNLSNGPDWHTLSMAVLCVTCCAVFMAKNWCCPSAPHTYPKALLSVTSLAMKEILFTTCSCSITWEMWTRIFGFVCFFFSQSTANKFCKSRFYCNSNQNSRPISHQWSWCLTWKCWPRSSACACLATEQLLPYPGEKKQKHYSIEGKQMYIHQSST